jgi:chromosome segregation ATPase
MNRINQWKAQLRTARAELKHKERQMNAAVRSFGRTRSEIARLEEKINALMAKT